jgi:hypothetical protein
VTKILLPELRSRKHVVWVALSYKYSNKELALLLVVLVSQQDLQTALKNMAPLMVLDDDTTGSIKSHLLMLLLDLMLLVQPQNMLPLMRLKKHLLRGPCADRGKLRLP